MNRDFRVLLHGTLAIFEYDNAIEVRVPDLGPECVYRAGDWLAETTIRAGATLELIVPPASAAARAGRIPRENNIVLEGRRPADAGSPYATLLLPIPDGIESYSRILQGSFEGRDSNAAWERSSSVHLFTYEAVDTDRVSLSNHPWSIASKPETDAGDALLSILADPETEDLSEGYASRAFEATVALFRDLDLRWPASLRMGLISELVGRPKYLFRDLFKRRLWMADLGADVRRYFENPSADTQRALLDTIEFLNTAQMVDPPWCMPMIISTALGPRQAAAQPTPTPS